MDTVKIDARDVNFWYGDFHALKESVCRLRKNRLLRLSGLPVVESLPFSGFSTG